MRSSLPDDTPPLHFKAQFGRNTFVVRYHHLTAKMFPDHVKATTIYGRLAGKNVIVNVDFKLDYDESVRLGRQREQARM